MLKADKNLHHSADCNRRRVWCTMDIHNLKSQVRCCFHLKVLPGKKIGFSLGSSQIKSKFSPTICSKSRARQKKFQPSLSKNDKKFQCCPKNFEARQKWLNIHFCKILASNVTKTGIKKPSMAFREVVCEINLGILVNLLENNAILKTFTLKFSKNHWYLESLSGH